MFPAGVRCAGHCPCRHWAGGGRQTSQSDVVGKPPPAVAIGDERSTGPRAAAARLYLKHTASTCSKSVLPAMAFSMPF